MSSIAVRKLCVRCEKNGERMMDPVRLGVVGLGRAFTLMLGSFLADKRIRLVGCADPRKEARERFSAEFGARAYEDVAALCADEAVEAVYLASPHQFHAAQAIVAASAGRHVLVEKPMALTLADCLAMADATQKAGVHMIVGHSHSFDAPIRAARACIGSGTYGALRMIHAMYYTDFLYRPRRPEELDTTQGGGAVFNQAPHQVDVIRLLGGGRLASVRAMTGAWDTSRPTEGAYAALLRFEDGAFASLTYSGYAHFDGDALMGDVGESGAAKEPGHSYTARRALREAGPEHELSLRTARGYGTAPTQRAATQRWHEHFGLVIASCDGADLQPLPDRLRIHGDDGVIEEALARPAIPRQEVLDELVDAVRHGIRPLHDAAWGAATMEACLGILESARIGQDVELRHQVGLTA
jgi:phthalate 4,5-cis-dihydrodiol dehydrogenase